MPDSTDATPEESPVLSLDEFQDFVSRFFLWSSTVSADKALEVQREYLETKYPDDEERLMKHARLAAALRYLQENTDSFDYERVSVVSQSEALISKRLIAALWLVFSHPSERCLKEPPPVELLKRIIAQMP